MPVTQRAGGDADARAAHRRGKGQCEGLAPNSCHAKQRLGPWNRCHQQVDIAACRVSNDTDPLPGDRGPPQRTATRRAERWRATVCQGRAAEESRAALSAPSAPLAPSASARQRRMPRIGLMATARWLGPQTQPRDRDPSTGKCHFRGRLQVEMQRRRFKNRPGSSITDASSGPAAWALCLDVRDHSHAGRLAELDEFGAAGFRPTDHQPMLDDDRCWSGFPGLRGRQLNRKNRSPAAAAP